MVYSGLPALRLRGSGGRRHSLVALGRWLCTRSAPPEPVEVIEQRFNFLPRVFRWRGDVRRIRTIVRVWDCAATGWRSPRRYFRVICQNGSYVLFQDLRAGTWFLSPGGR